MECFATMHQSISTTCYSCKDYGKCYTLSKAREEKQLFRDLDKKREEERYLDILRKRGYPV